MQVLETANGLLTTVTRLYISIKNNVTNYYNDQSLPELTKLTRVEPLTIVGSDIAYAEIVPDVLHNLVNIFSAYYLQAVSVLTKIGNIEVIRLLDRLNPDRDSAGFVFGEEALMRKERGLEQAVYSLEAMRYSLATLSRPALEDQGGKPTTELANLSVGKMLTVEISTSGEHDSAVTVKVPVSVRLLVSSLPQTTITHLLANKSEDRGLVERFHAWRAGRIGFIRDMIFCQDLIDEQKRAMMTDSTGTLSEIVRRVNNAKKFGLLTKNPSLVSASNLYVISKETATEIEGKLGGKLSSARIRQKMFDSSYAMVIVVIDREYEQVDVHVRGAGSSTLTFRELKNPQKTKDSDGIADMLKNLAMGLAPV